MIPIRVTMSGWMRYREQVTADFAGARLLSICGENGSGKSSIFDAITFALFGHHRYGTQHVDELISDGGDQCAVELEFEQEGKRYRVRRTRGRRAAPGSQGLWVWDAIADDWATVPNTQYVRGLNAALAALIRITPEAFTSSFLLQQGAATDFLDAKPAERFSVVSSLVNLEEYQALEKRAREVQRGEAAEVQRLSTKLLEFDGVDAESLELLRTRLEQAAEQRQAAERDRDGARLRREAAREYARIKLQIDAANRQMESATELLAEADQIEENARRFDSLDGEIAAVRQIEEELQHADAAATAATEAQRRLTAIDLESLAATGAAAAGRLADAVAAAERATSEQQTAAAEERAAADFLRLAEQIMTLRQRLTAAEQVREGARRELAHLPAREAEATHVRAVAAALPLLRDVGRARQRVERIEKDDPRGTLTMLDGAIERLAVEHETASQNVQATAILLAEAQDTAARAHAEAVSLRDQVARRREGADEAVCSRCGQRVDPAQARQELKALTEQAGAADRQAAVAGEAAVQARTENAEAIRRRDETQNAARQADADRRALLQRIEELNEAIATANDAYRQFVDEAPEALRETVPATVPLTRLHEVYREQQRVAGRADEIETDLRRLHALQGAARTSEHQIIQVREDLAVLEERAGVRIATVADAGALHAVSERRLRDAKASLDASKQEERDARSADSAAGDALAAAQEESRGLEQTSATLTQTAGAHRRTAQRIADRVDTGLRDRALEDPQTALDLLERERERLSGANERKAQLAEARRLHSHFGGMRAKLAEDLDRIPEVQRIDEGAAQSALDTAEAILKDTGLAWEHCQREVSRMERDLEQVEAMRTDLARSETRSQRLRRLVEILGKNGLQGALVSEALETVMSHANAFLERLTGGTLVLRLEHGEGDSLELKAQDVTCMREARSVQALSGSQKFRCAVAIAAGIGQYAGAGGMRSIVIDEGFGSLDQQGQHLIIEELKNLAEHMDRVIVVSHLDAFSDRVHFPDQIRVIRDGDRSRIERAS